MSIPTVTTQINNNDSNVVSPTADLDKDPYAINQIRYPRSGIGTDDVPSHVVFYINLPASSKYIGNNAGNVVQNANSASTQNYDLLSQQGGHLTISETGTNSGALISAASQVVSDPTNIGKAVTTGLFSKEAGAVIRSLDLRPKLTRINRTIALYMPDTVAVQYNHRYSEVDATTEMGDIGKYASIGGGITGNNIVDQVKGLAENVFSQNPTSFNQAATAELVTSFAEKAGAVGAGFTDLALKSLGKAVNPHAEMIFKATENREYQFTFDLIPRSQAETIDIYNIIKTFKAFAAPEVTAESGGRYWIPPAQFDIKFYFRNEENPVIAKISTCVLKSIIVNYGAAGAWATFQDGAPLHINLQLSFTETDIITRELIEAQGY